MKKNFVIITEFNQIPINLSKLTEFKESEINLILISIH